MHSTHPDFQAPSEEMEAKINETIAELTLEEKITLMAGYSGGQRTHAISRAGIPALKFADGPMGVHWWTNASTSYPASIAGTAAWDAELAYQLGAALGRDCRARGVHVLLAPGVNIYRSPLCGRNFEYCGEDPHLAAQTSTQYIKGVQSQRVAATIKHYALNFQEYERHHVSTDVDERTMREVYLHSFETAVKEGGVACIMAAYNLVNGEHCSQHDYLNNTILKGEWGFDGLLMSDWVSTYDTVGAALGGLDLEMPHADIWSIEKVKAGIDNGRIPVETIDEKVRRLLRLMHAFNWVDSEQKDESIPEDDPQTVAVARKVIQSGAVLLKNENGILPLTKEKVKSIAVIGSHSYPAMIGGGGSSFNPPFRSQSILEGVRRLAGDAIRVEHSMGVNSGREVVALGHGQFEYEPGKKGFRAEYFDNPRLEGKPVSHRIDERVQFNFGLDAPFEGIGTKPFSARWTTAINVEQTGDCIFYVRSNGGTRLRIDGSVIFDNWTRENTEMTIPVRHNLTAGRHEVVFEFNPVDRWREFLFSWEPASMEENDRQSALRIAKECDVVILCTGFKHLTESEGFDRTWELPEGQDAFINEVLGQNPNTILVLTAGGSVDANPWIDRLAALLHIWYPGQEADAIADLLFGEVTPSGKLPMTWERRLEDRSSYHCYHDHNNDRRVSLEDGVFTGYRHHDETGVEPLFPFGFGLSYTSFEISNVRLSAEKIAPGEELHVHFDLTNTGGCDGAEVVQLYAGAVNPPVPRPKKELKGYLKTNLQPGETRSLTISLKPEALRRFDNHNRRWVLDRGEYQLFLGVSSGDIASQLTFNLV